jgi:predicted TIM-barrel fold metal-dependent hydrolase
MPEWSLEGEQKLRDTYGVKTVMLSLSVPGATCAKGEASAKLARETNDFCVGLRDAEPSKFGILAALPSLLDKDLVLKELDYAYDVCKADGITLFSRYGDGHKYLGHPDFDYLWEALDKRAAVVFMHPTHTTFLDWFNKNIPQPLVDFPLETTKTAIDLVINGHMRRFPNVKIILSHGGGTLPYLISRPASTLASMRPDDFNADQLIEDAKKFYFDVAVTGHELPLSLLQDFAQPDHLLFGSDYPYAPWSIIDYHIKGLDKFEFKNPDMKENIANKNALKLFPRLAQYYM